MLSAVCTYLHCDPYSITITHDHKFPVIIEWRKHPFPFRTRQLSSTSPMILRGQLCGKVGRRRDNMKGPRGNLRAFFFSCNAIGPPANDSPSAHWPAPSPPQPSLRSYGRSFTPPPAASDSSPSINIPKASTTSSSPCSPEDPSPAPG